MPNLGDVPVKVISSNKVLLNNKITPGTIVINSNGKISSIHEKILSLEDLNLSEKNDNNDDNKIKIKYTNYGDLIVMPGFVDTHVHLNEPGRTEWEGFETGTKSAAFGGVTTVIDMPLNAIPPTTNVENLKIKINAAKNKCWIDVGFWGGVIPGNHDDLVPLINHGVRGFKCFLIDSGVEEFPCVGTNDLIKAMQVLNGQPTLLMFHAEMLPPISDSLGDSVTISVPPLAPHGPLSAYKTFLESRPLSFETYAIDEIVSLAKNFKDLPLHIVHLSSNDGLKLLQEARKEGIKITAEACFHYLYFCSNEIPDGRTDYKCCPPIRDFNNRELLWKGLENGLQEENSSDSSLNVLKTVVSDHSPCTPQLKLLENGNFFSAWGGVASVGLGFKIMWTECLRRYIADRNSKLKTTKNKLFNDDNESNVPTKRIKTSNEKKDENGKENENESLNTPSDDNSESSSATPTIDEIATGKADKHKNVKTKSDSDAKISEPIESACHHDNKIDEIEDKQVSEISTQISSNDEQAVNDIIIKIWKWCSKNTAAQVGLSHRKGNLLPGYDADIAVFDPSVAADVLSIDDLKFKNKLSPYVGRKFIGSIQETIVRGKTVYSAKSGLSEDPLGELILEARK